MLKPNINFLIPTHTCQGVPLPFLTHAASSPFSIMVQPQPMPPSSLAFFSHVAFLPSTKPPKILDPFPSDRTKKPMPPNPCFALLPLTEPKKLEEAKAVANDI